MAKPLQPFNPRPTVHPRLPLWMPVLATFLQGFLMWLIGNDYHPIQTLQTGYSPKPINFFRARAGHPVNSDKMPKSETHFALDLLQRGHKTPGTGPVEEVR